MRVRLALMKEWTVKYKQTTVKMASIVARWWSAKWSLWYWRTRDESAEHGKKHKHQAGGLEPESIKGAAHGRDKRFSAGKDRVEQAVFLYNGLQSIFYRGNLCHFGYCSAKIGPIERKE